MCKNLKTHKVLDDEFEFVSQPSNEELKDRTVFRYRLKISKKDEMRYISHLDWQNTVVKTLYRSGLNLYFSQGFNPTPKFSLGVALPIFVESECELIDIEIYNEIEEKELVKILNSVSPNDIEILSAKEVEKNIIAIDVLAQ